MVENRANYNNNEYLEATLVNKAMKLCDGGGRVNVPATINHGKVITIAFLNKSDDPTWFLTETTTEGACITKTTLVLPSKERSYLSVSQWDAFMGHIGMPQKHEVEPFHLERFNNLLPDINES